MKIVTRAQMQSLDARTISQGGISEKRLIARAGLAAANWVKARFPLNQSFLVLTGKGNNGADGRVMAHWLKKWKFPVCLLDFRKALSWHHFKKYIGSQSQEVVVVDALFGTGLDRPLQEPWIELIRRVRDARHRVISLDIPSGLDADTGQPQGAALRADYTLTFGLPKVGLIAEEAADWTGELHLLDLGFPSRFVEAISTPYDLLCEEEMDFFFTPRPRSIHKGRLGHLLVLGGSRGFAGTPALAARAALRAGAGLVSLGVPQELEVISALHAGPEVMTFAVNRGDCFSREGLVRIKHRLSKVDAVVVGPGMGVAPASLKFLKELLKIMDVPVVYDADALNLLALEPRLMKKLSRAILTPHPGEMARLTTKPVPGSQAQRLKQAGDVAKRYGVELVLKGARSIIAHPQRQHGTHGRAYDFSVNALAGNPGMATAGCGDGLAGILGALLAQRLAPPDAARAGVLLHARAGDLAMPTSGGGLASDLIEAVPLVLDKLRSFK